MLALTLVALLLLPVGSVLPGGATTHAPPSRGLAPSVTISGALNVSSLVTYANTSLTLLGGISIRSGGTLSLSNVSMTMTELSNLANGIEVQKGGALRASQLSVTSSSASNHWWMRADPGSTLSLHGGAFTDLGGSSTPGVDVQTSSATVDGISFDQYTSALKVEGAGATVSYCTFLHSTATSASTYIVSAVGGGTGLALDHSTFRTMANVGALSLAVGNASIVANTFTLNASGTNINPIWIGYSGRGTPNAGGTVFLDNHVDGADVGDIGAPNVNISGNVVNDPGPNRNFGIHASVTIGTSPGIWIHNLTIDHNVVSNYTYYGIRIEQNVTRFHVDGNSILPPREPQPAGVPQPNGVYAIRSVNNGTIDDNYIDMSVGPSLASIGICLESNTSDITIRGNVVLNATQNALNIQGNDGHFDSATWYEDGASDRNVVEDNQFVNDLTNQQTKFMIVAVVLWQWANYTTVANNTFVGWGNVSGVSITYDGAAVLTSCSYGTFYGNRIVDASFGFIFRNFGSVKLTGVGTYNRSANVVDGNALYGITKQAVVEDTSDGMGPIANVIDVLWNTSTASKTPSGYLQAIHAATELGGWSGNGTYGLTLRTLDPVTGVPTTYATYLRWTSPAFGLSVRGSALGTGTLDFPGPVATASGLSYSLPSAGALSHSFCLGNRNVNYSVSYATSGGSRTSVTVSAPGGNASFGTSSSGQVNVSASLSGSTSTSGGAGCLAGQGVPSGNGGSSTSVYAVQGTVWDATNSTALSGATVQVTGGASTTTGSAGSYAFSLANGTYTLTASAPGHTSASATITIAGTGVTRDFNLTRSTNSSSGGAANYSIAFTQTGLPSSASWWVTLNGTTLHSANTTIGFSRANGTYAYTVGGPTGYAPTPKMGSVSVRGAAARVSVTFSAANSTSARYAVTFNASGLPSSSVWAVTLNGTLQNSSGTLDAFAEPNGTYAYSVGGPIGFTASPSSGSVTVGGGSVTVAVLFNATSLPSSNYSITFSESGLPTSTAWWVTLNGTSAHSSTSTVVFSRGNGTYPYTVGGPAGYTASPGMGSLTVRGSAVSVSVLFSTTVPGTSNYTVDFTESGLPTSSSWTVSLNASAKTTTGAALVFSESNGTYSYLVTAPAGFAAAPSSGTVNVLGSAVSVSLLFTAIVPSSTNFTITFSETGLPASTSWWVTLNGTSQHSSTSTVAFSRPNGTYSYTVGGPSGYTVSPSSMGSLMVQGGSVSRSVTFASSSGGSGIVSLYLSGTVTVSGSGTPLSGAKVALQPGGTFSTGTNGTYRFLVTNGSYSISVKDPGYNSQTATVTISGASVVRNFALIQHKTLLSGTVSLFPSATTRLVANVSLAGTPYWQATNGSGGYEMPVPNGTYTIVVAVPGLTPVSRTVVVVGQPLVENFTVTPRSVGSAPGPGVLPLTGSAIALLMALVGILTSVLVVRRALGALRLRRNRRR